MKIAHLYILIPTALFVFCVTSFAASPDQQKVVEIPFSYERGQIFVDVKLNGLATTYPMMLNTGIGRSVFSHSVAKTAGVPITFSNANVTISKNYKLQALIQGMEIGELRPGNLLVAISAKEGVAGILGNDFLRHYILQIDFPKRLIRFYDKSPFPKDVASRDGTMAVLQMKLGGEEQVPVVEEVYVNGKKIKASLDTGFPGALALTPSAVKYLGLKSSDETKSQTEAMLLETLAVGTLKLNSPLTLLYGKGSGLDMSLDSMGGVVGNGFMELHVVTFDFKNRVVVFQ